MKFLKDIMLFILILLFFLISLILFDVAIKDIVVLLLVSIIILLIPVLFISEEVAVSFRKFIRYDFLGITFALFLLFPFLFTAYIYNLNVEFKFNKILSLLIYFGSFALLFLFSNIKEEKHSFVGKDLIMLFFTMTITNYFSTDVAPQDVIDNIPLVTVILSTVVIPSNLLILIFLGKRGLPKDDIGYKFNFDLKDAIYILSFLIISIVLLLISGFSFQNFIDSFSLKYLLLKFAFVTLISSISEEIIFRLFFINILNYLIRSFFSGRASIILSIMISSLVFGLYHFRNGLWQVFWASAFGLILGVLFFARKKISNSIILHSIINVIIWA